MRESARGKKQDRDADAQRKARRSDKNREFEDALRELPARADPQKEIEWVKSHPAMTRQDRQKTREHILISADDVWDSSNGPCPSRAAAQQLQHWVNDPKVFYKDYMAEIKRSMRDSVGAASTVDTRAAATVEDINAVLNVLTSQTPRELPVDSQDQSVGGMEDGSIV